MQRYKNTLYHKKASRNKDEVIAGIAVAFSMVPDSIAFSLIATLSPLVGLRASFILGIITAFFGGRPGMIVGTAGAMAVVQAHVIKDKGEDYLFVIMIIAGIVQVLLGMFRTGKFIFLISETVIIGFLNGLGIVIALTQIDTFREACGDPNPSHCEFIHRLDLLWMILETVVTFLFIIVAPKIPKIGKRLPSSMIAIIVCTLINYYGPKTKTVGDIKQINGSVFSFILPSLDKDIDFGLILELIIKGIEFALVGLIESLLTVLLIDEITRSRGNLD